MDQQSREARLKADHESLQALDAASSIFSMEVTGEPPDRYTLTFRGKGIGRDASASSEVTTIELHQIDLRMPYSYPNSPPDIRWITPILHPNVSFSGFVNLPDIGIVWTKEVPIDMLCERLWDVARAEFLNLNKATNYSAKNWFEKECQQPLPADHRPLRDQAAAASGTNIVALRAEGRPGRAVRRRDEPQRRHVHRRNDPHSPNAQAAALCPRRPPRQTDRRRGCHLYRPGRAMTDLWSAGTCPRFQNLGFSAVIQNPKAATSHRTPGFAQSALQPAHVAGENRMIIRRIARGSRCPRHSVCRLHPGCRDCDRGAGGIAVQRLEPGVRACGQAVPRAADQRWLVQPALGLDSARRSCRPADGL